MGAAAYNRGTNAIRADLDREQPSSNLQLLRDLTAYSAAHARVAPFQATVVRFGPRPGVVALMNRQRRGWAEQCYEYDSLWKLAASWRLAFVGLEADAHGRFIRVEPNPERV